MILRNVVLIDFPSLLSVQYDHKVIKQSNSIKHTGIIMSNVTELNWGE